MKYLFAGSNQLLQLLDFPVVRFNGKVHAGLLFFTAVWIFFGSGKSSFLAWLLGNNNFTCQGDWDLQTGLKISYLPQDLSAYRGRLDAFAKEHGLNYDSFLNQLKKLGLEREAFKQKIEEMSQGQKKRVALAKSLTEEASLYLWDEPANYLDLFNQDQLIKLLKKEQPAMLLVDHDQAFINAVAKERVSLQK